MPSSRPQDVKYGPHLIVRDKHMKPFKSLAETNPYLRDPVERKKRIAKSVRTSCAVEGITTGETALMDTYENFDDYCGYIATIKKYGIGFGIKLDKSLTFNELLAAADQCRAQVPHLNELRHFSISLYEPDLTREDDQSDLNAQSDAVPYDNYKIKFVARSHNKQFALEALEVSVTNFLQRVGATDVQLPDDLASLQYGEAESPRFLELHKVIMEL